MAQSRSFKEYIANRFYNEFFTAVSDFLEQNHRDLDISSVTPQRSGAKIP